jgi:peroxiredoxin
MPLVTIGDRPPTFRLPTAQGADVGLDDFAGRPVIVWFTKGMACPFCRQHMSQLARGYAGIKALGAEVLQVTLTRPERARVYARQFTLPFPYLCDPDYHVRRTWGMDVRSHGVGYYARTLLRGMTSPQVENDFGKLNPTPGELPNLLADEDAGFFILRGDGVVSFASAGAYVQGGVPQAIPGNDEILRELERSGTRAG